jgi:hypothetical protein
MLDAAELRFLRRRHSCSRLKNSFLELVGFLERLPEGVPLTLNIGMATGATVVDSFSRLMLASRSIRRERPALPSGMLDGLARMTPRSDRPPLEATDLRFGSTGS